MNHRRLVAQCGLESGHEKPGVEVPHWMFDTAVCVQMRIGPRPVACIDALRELNSLQAARSVGNSGSMLQAQHDSLLSEGGADANPSEPVSDSSEALNGFWRAFGNPGVMIAFGSLAVVNLFLYWSSIGSRLDESQSTSGDE